MVHSDILTVTTGYCHPDRWNSDSNYDEYTLKNYFSANILLGRTHNAAVCYDIMHRNIVPNGCYLLFKGLSPDNVPISYQELVDRNRQTFLRATAYECINHEGNPSQGKSCITLADMLQSGERTIPLHVSLSDVERLAWQL